MRNIELKARLQDADTARKVCEQLRARFAGEIRQTDTYFPAENGRLKLRESEPGDDYLVQYKRPDVAAAKACDYTIAVVPRGTKAVLAPALGTLAVVDKVRTLYLWRNVRIHLDRVTGLGTFIEFEAVLDPEHDDDDGYAKLAELTRAFGIAETDMMDVSYLEMTLAMASKERA